VDRNYSELREFLFSVVLKVTIFDRTRLGLNFCPFLSDFLPCFWAIAVLEDCPACFHRTTVGWLLLTSCFITLLLKVLPGDSFWWGLLLIAAGMAVLFARVHAQLGCG
jgi:hypothetical protein